MSDTESFDEFYAKIGEAVANAYGRNLKFDDASVQSISSETSKMLKHEDGAVDIHVDTTVTLKPEAHMLKTEIKINFRE